MPSTSMQNPFQVFGVTAEKNYNQHNVCCLDLNWQTLINDRSHVGQYWHILYRCAYMYIGIVVRVLLLGYCGCYYIISYLSVCVCVISI